MTGTSEMITGHLETKELALPDQHKTITVDGEKFQFTAMPAVYNVVDLNRDVIRLGAAEESLASFGADRPMPVLWAHDFSNPESNIGYALELAELAPGDARLPDNLKPFGGMWMRAQLDHEEEDARARSVFKKLKGGRITGFSLTFKVLAANRITHKGHPAREILKMQVFEAGPIFRGMNPLADLIEVKSAVSPADTPPIPSESESESEAVGSVVELARCKLQIAKLRALHF